MRSIDRYITYYKTVNNRYIDEVVYDKLKKTMEIYRKVDSRILDSEDDKGRRYTEIELPNFIFQLVVSSLENTSLNIKDIRLGFFHLYSNLRGKCIDFVIDCKRKIYYRNSISYHSHRCYLDTAIGVDYVIIETIIKQLELMGYKESND